MTEFEPVWDAADVCRIGTDLFVQLSQVTNHFGIDWLERHLGPRCRVHRVQFADAKAMHIDATFVPLALGKLMVNPGWEWLHMNVLSLGEQHAIVEKGEVALQEFLRDWGIEPAPCRFRILLVRRLVPLRDRGRPAARRPAVLTRPAPVYPQPSVPEADRSADVTPVSQVRHSVSRLLQSWKRRGLVFTEVRVRPYPHNPNLTAAPVPRATSAPAVSPPAGP